MRVGEKEKRSGRLVGAAETSKELEEWRRLQQKNLSILVLLKRKEWPQFHRESKVRQSQELILVEHLDRLERNDFCDFEKTRELAY